LIFCAERKRHEGTDFISSVPIRDLVNALYPAAPVEIHKAANQLRYRGFLIVGLIVDRKDVMPHNCWFYVHESRMRVARIQNF